MVTPAACACRAGKPKWTLPKKAICTTSSVAVPGERTNKSPALRPDSLDNRRTVSPACTGALNSYCSSLRPGRGIRAAGSTPAFETCCSPPWALRALAGAAGLTPDPASSELAYSCHFCSGAKALGRRETLRADREATLTASAAPGNGAEFITCCSPPWALRALAGFRA